MATAMGPLGALSDETLAHIFSCLDYDSAVIFSQETHPPLTERFLTVSANIAWRCIFQRHWFSPVESSTSLQEIDYMNECKERKQLVQNLVGSQPYGRCFVPLKNSDDADLEDPGFFLTKGALTHPGISGELVFLDTLNGCLSVYNMVASNEDMARNANNRNVQESYRHRTQVLFDEDYYNEDNLNLAEYFEMPPDNEVFAYDTGIGAKPIVGTNGVIDGSMVDFGRVLQFEEENLFCTEIVIWRKLQGESAYGDVRICRVPRKVYCSETCSKSNRLFVVFHQGQGPQQDPMDDEDSLAFGQRTIMAYPLMPANETHAASTPRYFPQPEFHITCNYFVSHMTVDCTGTLLVGTEDGTVEIWKPNGQSGMIRVAMSNSEDALIERAEHLPREEDEGAAAVENNDDDDDEGPDEPAAVENDGDEDDDDDGVMWVKAFAFPSHIPVEKCGFVSLHNNYADGMSLLLWKNRDNDPGFQIVSRVNLPLSCGPRSCIHYDGRRIIVLGQDRHIGTTAILVYLVFCSVEDVGLFPPSPSETELIEESGGVFNFTPQQPHVRFANLFRHAALGGIDSEESEELIMSCNERFIVVNTKIGNLLGGSAEDGDGLLIFDLKKH